MTDVLHKYSESLQSDRRHLIHQYKFVDLARKVVGVGSVGTRAWIMLLSGIDDQDPLLLQAKEANSSVLEAYTSPTPFSSHGERVVQGQRLMQAYDWKGSIEIPSLDPKSLAMYAGHCAWTLARAHARSGDRVAIAAYLGGKDAFDQAIADFSAAYADKNERDFARLEKAAAAGQIAVERGF
jgi:hypothetical protein